MSAIEKYFTFEQDNYRQPKWVRVLENYVESENTLILVQYNMFLLCMKNHLPETCDCNRDGPLVDLTSVINHAN